MRKLFLLLCVIIGMATQTNAQSQNSFKVEAYIVTNYAANNAVPVITFDMNHRIRSSKFLVVFSSRLTYKLGEGLGGIGYERKHVTTEVLIGFDMINQSQRFGTRLRLGNERYLFRAAYEYGSRHWYEAYVGCHIPAGNLKIGVGGMLRRFEGVGPRLDFITKRIVSVWIIPIQYDWEEREHTETTVVVNNSNNNAKLKGNPISIEENDRIKIALGIRLRFP